MAKPESHSLRTQTRHWAPVIEPHLWGYRQLLTLGAGRRQPWEGEPPSSSLCDWLQSLAEPARELFVTNRRLAQGHVGWEFLRQHGIGSNLDDK